MGDKLRHHLPVFAVLAIATRGLAVIDLDSATNGHDLAPDPQDLSRYVGSFGSFTGTPISSRYLVTANHIGQGTIFEYANGTSVTTTYPITFVATMDDLALYKIADSDPRSFSLTAPIYTQSTEVNQPLIVLGRGTFRGDPVTVNGNLAGWQWGNPSNDFTWGVNTVSQIVDNDDPVLGGNFLVFPFTNNGNIRTAALSGGDSGGAVFVKDPADNTYKLAATNTGVDGPYSTSPTGPFFNAALFDTRGLYIQNGDNTTTYIDPALNPDPVPSNSYGTRISSRLGFLESHIGLSTIAAWNSAAGGDWNSSLNWNSGVPNGTAAEADLFTAGITSQTLNVSNAITLAALHFNSTTNYHLNGTGSLTIQSATAPALVQVEQKTAEINIPVTFAGASIIHVSAGATLDMSQVSLSSGASVTLAAHGTEGAGTIQIHGLTLGSGAKLDLGDNPLTITDDSPATVASIRSLLASGFNAGSWDGNGIDSSAAHNDTSFKTALGYKDTGSSIVIAYTYYGDNNLDGVVNTTDFQMFLDGLSKNGNSWSQGDYTYDGKVDLGNDFILFLTNYLSQGGALGDLAPIVAGDSDLSTSQKAMLLAVVPEPSMPGVFVVGAAIAVVHRRRGKRSRKDEG